MSTRVRANAELFTHDNRALSTSPVTITLPANTTSILIDNVDTAISALVSFDASVTFKAIKAGSTLSIDCDNIKSFTIKSASGTPNIEMLFGSEQ